MVAVVVVVAKLVVFAAGVDLFAAIAIVADTGTNFLAEAKEAANFAVNLLYSSLELHKELSIFVVLDFVETETVSY